MSRSLGDHAGPTWVLLPPGTELPTEWTERAVPLLLIPLLPAEVASVIERKRRQEPGDPLFLGLVARGRAARDIARQLDITDRSVYRRLAALRDDFGVVTNAELAAELARRGF